MNDLRTAAKAALSAMQSFESGTNGLYEGEFAEEIAALRTALAEDALQRFTDVNQEIEAALAEPVLQTCNCRWDGEVQVQQCTLHEAHVDAIKEWAQRAKFAEKKLAALAEPVQEPVAYAVGRTLHWHEGKGVNDAKLYLAPPQRKPATIDEMFDRMDKAPKGVFFGHDPMTIWMEAWRAAEQHHGIT